MLTPQEMKEAEEFAERRIVWEERRTAALLRAAEQSRKLRGHLNITKLIAVHMTDYFPEKGVILTKNVADPGIVVHGRRVRFPRETIHFTLNGPVGGHSMGDWNDKKYAILIPLPFIINRIYNLAPEDSWVIGNLTLPRGTEILGKQKDFAGKRTKLKKIIVPNNTSTYGYVSERVAQKGYHPSQINMWNWSFAAWGEAMQAINEEIGDGTDITYTFSKMAKRLGKESTRHSGSLFHRCEETFSQAHQMLRGNFPFYGTKKHIISSFQGSIQELISDLRELIAKKKRSVMINSEEINSLNRLVDILSDISKELDIILHKELVEGSIFKAEIEAGRWTDKERKWLMREYDFIEKMLPLVQLHDKGGILRILRRNARIERRAYQTYQKLEEEISRLNELDPTYINLTRDIEEHMKFAQAHLAKSLSRTSTMIPRLIEGNHWDKVEEIAKGIEQVIAMVEQKLNSLHEILKAREKSHKIRNSARHWKIAA